ncbi:hypothetical protein H4R34_005480, partial [Dimargaris verticillata]
GYKLIDKVLFPRQDFSVAYDGKRAYIFGGRHVGNYYNDLTAFNPKTLEFTPVETTGPPPSPRSGHTAIFIGRAMLIFGGRLEDGSFDDQNVYMYTVQHSRWFPLAPEGPALSGRKGHACSLYGHAMCVSFGFTASGTANDVALFDLRTVKQGGPRWQVLTPATETVPPPRAYHSSCVQDHKLYVFGGCSGDVFYNDLWVMDLTTNTWMLLHPQGQAPMPRANHSAFLIDGYMVVAGGHLGNAKVCRETFAYNIVENCWYYANHTDRSWTRRPNGRFLATRDRLFYLGGIVPEGELPYVVFTALSSRPILTNDVFSPVTSATSLPSFAERRDGPADQSQTSFRLDGIDSGPTSQNLSLATQSFTKGLSNARPADSSDSPILNATVAGQSLQSLSLIGNEGERRSTLQQSMNSLTSFTGHVDDTHRPLVSQEHDGNSRRLSRTPSFPRNVFSDDQIQAIQTDPLKLKLLQTLTYLHRELAESKGAVNSLSSTVVERIAEAERARQNALQEAMYLRTKCQALEEANVDFLLHAEVTRTSVLEKQLANLINDNNALRTQLHEATSQLDQTRQRLNDTHRHRTASDQAYTDMEELYSQAQGDLGALTQQNEELVQQHTQHLNELQSLRVEVDAQVQAKQMLEGELAALKASDKKTQQVIQSALVATTAANQRVQQLQQQLTHAQAEVNRLEAANRDLSRHAEDQSAALSRATSRCDELVAQRDAAAAQIDCLQALTTLVEETDMKEEMIAKLEDQIGQSATRIRKLEQELGQAHSRLETYRLTLTSSSLPAQAESPRLVRRDSATAGAANNSSPDLMGKGDTLGWQQRLRQLESRYLQSQRDSSRTKHDLTRLRQDVRASDEKRLVAETQLQRRDVQLEDIRTKVRALLYHLQVSGNLAAQDDRSASPTLSSTQELAQHLERLLQTPQQRHVPISTGALLDVASLRSLML